MASESTGGTFASWWLTARTSVSGYMCTRSTLGCLSVVATLNTCSCRSQRCYSIPVQSLSGSTAPMRVASRFGRRWQRPNGFSSPSPLTTWLPTRTKFSAMFEEFVSRPSKLSEIEVAWSLSLAKTIRG